MRRLILLICVVCCHSLAVLGQNVTENSDADAGASAVADERILHS